MDDGLREAIDRVVRIALEEDLGGGDITTEATVMPEARGRAAVVARESLVLAGIEAAETAFRFLDPDAELDRLAGDGDVLVPGAIVLRIAGRAGAMLSAERVALNLLQRLSGISTLTRQYVNAVAGTGAIILDTRKTTPGLRALEKYAVRCGGGRNHRFGLFDAILIKDNHLAALAREQSDPVTGAIRRARARFPGRSIEVEADRVDQVKMAVAAGADVVLLDNMSLEGLRESVGLVGGRAKTEASGGVNLGTVRAIAETGVDYISVGALTHSARSVDLALDLEW